MFVEHFCDKNAIMVVVDFGKLHFSNHLDTEPAAPAAQTRDSDDEGWTHSAFSHFTAAFLGLLNSFMHFVVVIRVDKLERMLMSDCCLLSQYLTGETEEITVYLSQNVLPSG
jgi:hypothetical protein